MRKKRDEKDEQNHDYKYGGGEGGGSKLINAIIELPYHNCSDPRGMIHENNEPTPPDGERSGRGRRPL